MPGSAPEASRHDCIPALRAERICRAPGRRLPLAMAVCVFLTAGLGWAPRGSAAGVDAEHILSESGFHGGLVVLVGRWDADWAASLAKAPNVLVHGLVTDREALPTVRDGIRKAGLVGRVSAAWWRGPALPYADGMVNLLLVPDERVGVADDEIDRVLAPLGTAWVRRDGAWASRRKAWPADVDEWSHARYDATGNAVSRDKGVGPPRFLQWEATPRWNRGVKTSCLVTARGRLFFILDDSHFAERTRTWSLIARDASNGVLLWRHELPSWGGARGGKKVGPAQVNRRLIARGDRVLATLGESAPVSVLDAATGKVLRELSQTNPTEECILSEGMVVALVDLDGGASIRRGRPSRLRIVAADIETGKTLWEHEAETVLPLTMAADGTQVVYHDGRVIRALDQRTGAERWASPPTGQKIVHRDKANPDSPGAEKGTIILAPQLAPTLILYQGVAAFAGGRQLNVVSTEDGRELWRTEYAPSNYSVPVDLFGFGGWLWGPSPKMNLWRPVDDDISFVAYDPQTGKVQKRVTGRYGFRFQHHRCHQMRVVGDHVIAGRAGIEFLDTNTGAVVHQHWTRGSCYYGVLPANGRLYVPPHDCACYVRAKLSGFLAMNAAPPRRTAPIDDEERIERGPAYGGIAAGSVPQVDDWPTYRHDMARSGRSATRVTPKLLLGWRSELGGRLTSPVVADGRVYLASTDAHTLHALDASTGEFLWQVTFDARIDSPPTMYGALVFCGCRDGSVHALRATDGALAWRFLGAPARRMIVSRGQVESVWPVPGSVLVVDNRVYVAAGRSSYLDGGLVLYGLEPQTGRTVTQATLTGHRPDGSEILDEQGVVGYLNDVLSTDGERLFLRHQVLDKAGKPLPDRVTHLHGPDGFLSADTTTRLLWTYAPMYTSPHQGAFYDSRLSRMLFPSGRILVEGDQTIYGYGQNHYSKPQANPGGEWALFAAAKRPTVPPNLTAMEYRRIALKGTRSVQFRWWKPVPLQVRAMAKTRDVLFVAGPRGGELASRAALAGQAPGLLLAVSPEDGRVLAEMPLPAPPVWDGMAAARGKLYLSLADGSLLCLGADGQPLPPYTAAVRASGKPEEPGFVGHWPFDEGSGDTAHDTSGVGNHAEVAPSAWRGRALLSRGRTAAAVQDHPLLQFGTGDFTIAFAVALDGYDCRILGKEDFPRNWWVVNVLKDGRAELVLGTGREEGKSVRPTTKSPLAKGGWTHLAFVVDRTKRTVTAYVDGNPERTTKLPDAFTGALDVKGRDLHIPSTYKPFKGRFADLRVFRRPLTGAEVKAIADALKAPK